MIRHAIGRLRARRQLRLAARELVEALNHEWARQRAMARCEAHVARATALAANGPSIIARKDRLSGAK